jgi:hypothetical protein
MTKLNTDSTIGAQTSSSSSSSSSKTTIEETNKIHKTLTKKPKKNFLTLNKTAVSSSSSSSNSNRRLSLNSNEILKLTTQATSTKITNSTRRKSLSNPFQLNNDSEKQLKKFKSKIDYLKAETLTSYDENLKQIKNDYNNKNKGVSKYFFL